MPERALCTSILIACISRLLDRTILNKIPLAEWSVRWDVLLVVDRPLSLIGCLKIRVALARVTTIVLYL